MLAGPTGSSVLLCPFRRRHKNSDRNRERSDGSGVSCLPSRQFDLRNQTCHNGRIGNNLLSGLRKRASTVGSPTRLLSAGIRGGVLYLIRKEVVW